MSACLSQVAEVILAEGKPKVERVVYPVDCGIAVNPQQIRAQIESSIVYGLFTLFRGELVIQQGAVQQSKLRDYLALRASEMPKIEVHIVKREAPPGGMGGSAVPPVLQAVANAMSQLPEKESPLYRGARVGHRRRDGIGVSLEQPLAERSGEVSRFTSSRSERFTRDPWPAITQRNICHHYNKADEWKERRYSASVSSNSP